MFPYTESFLLIPLFVGSKYPPQDWGRSEEGKFISRSENTCFFDFALLYMNIVHKKHGKEDI